MPAAVTVKSRVVFERNNFGQFAAACEKAAEETVRKTIERGARTSRNLAPAGSERWRYSDRPGYVPLKRSIRTRMVGKTKGYWYSIAPHAMYVEEGTNAHIIRGKLKFAWNGDVFYWNNYAFGPVGSGKKYENWTKTGGAWVRHPGTSAQPFMRPAYERVVRGQMMEIAKREFPG